MPQMQEGIRYRSLRKTITINLLDFVLFSHDEEFHTIVQLSTSIISLSKITDM